MSTGNIPSKARPLYPKSVQPDMPHLGQLESEMAEQTTALWYRHGMGHFSWAWFDHGSAPVAVLDSSNFTGTPFIFIPTASGAPGSYNLQLPWLLHKRTAYVEVLAYFACGRYPIALRCSLNTLITTITGETGPWSAPAQKLKSFKMPLMEWQRGSIGYPTTSMYRVLLTVPVDDTISTTQRVALRIAAMYDAAAWPFAAGTGVELNVYLMALHARNVPIERI